MKKTFFILVLGWLATSPAAWAACHCFCKAIVAGSPVFTIPNPAIDWSPLATYTGAACTALKKAQTEADCATKCSAAAAADPNFNNPAWWCAKIGAPFNGNVTAYSAVGTWSYQSAQQKHVKCCATGGVCSCPTGWEYDPPQPLNRRCKKAIANCTLTPGSVPPGSWPANGTTLGNSWNTWGMSIFQYIPATCTPVVINAC